MNISSIGQALALVPSGCSILTCSAGDRSTGMLASWVQQVSFDPPMVTVAVRRGRPIEELILAARRFTLNVLGEDPGSLFRHFAGGFGPQEVAFAGLTTVETSHGVELAEAVGYLACEIESSADAGDHTVFIARVVAGRALPGAKPYVHLRKTGLSY